MQQFGSSAVHSACSASGRIRWNTFIPRRSEVTSPALRNWVKWWLIVDSLKSRAAASSPEISSPVAAPNKYETILTRAGSAKALSRNAICNASASLSGPEATGAQHTGAVMSITGKALGMSAFCHRY